MLIFQGCMYLHQCFFFLETVHISDPKMTQCNGCVFIVLTSLKAHVIFILVNMICISVFNFPTHILQRTTS